MLKKSTIAFFVLAASASCASFANPVQIQSKIPFAESSKIPQNIRNECTELGSQLAKFTQEFGKSMDVKVELTDKIDIGQKGRVLYIEITDAVSMGNAFSGHQKATSAHGVLYEDGKKIAEFDARRQSMGGAFAGYKGSCSVLGRTVKTIGKDIAQWLKDPKDQATLGDM
ncbi:MAG: hypothetical protein EOO07_22000 [Chitinophagaceae bacterium]|nr:MAG: hypothetical protein EOO07_22000 [Chitinophagaceae bacterium]